MLLFRMKILHFVHKILTLYTILLTEKKLTRTKYVPSLHADKKQQANFPCNILNLVTKALTSLKSPLKTRLQYGPLKHCLGVGVLGP